MLDTASTFDGLVLANAANAEQANRILTNGFYRNIAGSLGGTQEYMAAERLLALHLDARFDLVIVDTPPTRNALDFLDAPRTLARFLDHPVFKLMMMPTRTRPARVEHRGPAATSIDRQGHRHRGAGRCARLLPSLRRDGDRLPQAAPTR